MSHALGLSALGGGANHIHHFKHSSNTKVKSKKRQVKLVKEHSLLTPAWRQCHHFNRLSI